jgi:PBP1b-binding outer membrane lipoprotein LpoB
MFAILTIIILLLFFKGCEMKKDYDNLLNNSSSLANFENKFDKKSLKDSSTMATQNQMLLSQVEALKLGVLKLNGDIKIVQSQVSQKQEIKIDSVLIPFVPKNYADTLYWIARLRKGDSSRYLIDSLLNNSVIVPQPFKMDEKWFKIFGKVQKKGLLLDSFSLVNESTVTLGYKKSGFLNLKREAVVEVNNSNPYLNVTKLKNVIIKEKKSILQSKLFWFGIGIIGGVGLKAL